MKRLLQIMLVQLFAIVCLWATVSSQVVGPLGGASSFSGLSGSATCAQLPALTGVITTSAGSCVTSSGTAIVTVTIQKFTASGTYTPHAGIQFAVAECIGNGGGGGGTVGSAAGDSGAGGGGAGSYSRVRLTAAQIGASQTITVGATGIGGTAGNNAGTSGGDVSLGTLCVGKGGTGGSGAAASSSGSGGVGGIAGTGDITSVGNGGGSGFGSGNTNQSAYSGYGASSVFGGGTVQPVQGTTGCTTGASGGNFGAGGAGAVCLGTASNTAGGSGATGIVIVTEYNNQ